MAKQRSVKQSKRPSPAKEKKRARPAKAKGSQPAKAKGSQPAKAKSSRPAKPKAMFEKIAFTMFSVQDATRARGFYENVLGLERGLASDNGVWTEYDLPGGGCLALFCMPNVAPHTPGSASIAFEVADLDALNERLTAAGVDYTTDVVHGPNCRMSNIRDTEGNGIILHQLNRK